MLHLMFRAGRWLLLITAMVPTLVMAAGKPPSTPFDLVATVVGDTLSLSWAPSTDDEGVEGYNVYQDGQYLTTVSGTLYTTKIDPTQLTQFSVAAFDSEPRRFSPRSIDVAVPESLLPTDLTIPPSTPVGLRGEFNGSELTLTWAASTDDELVAGYNVYRDNRYLDTVLDTQWSGVVDTRSVHDWTIVAFDTRRNFSVQSEILTLPNEEVPIVDPVPSTPMNVVAVWTQGVVDVTWDPSSDDVLVTGYNVYQDGAYLNTVFATQFSATDVDDVPREYSIVAFDDDGNFSPQSVAATAPLPSTPIDRTEPPSVPTDLLATTSAQANQDNVALSWTESTDNTRVAGYNVYVDDSYHATVFEPSYDFMIASGAIVVVSVVAFDSDGNFSARSDSIRTSSAGEVAANEAPTVPTNLVGQYIEEGSVARVEVSWTASTDDLGVAGYNVYLDGDYAATVFEPAYATELEAGQAVAVRVVAFDVERLFSPRSEQLQLPDVGNRAPIIRNLDDQFLAAGAVWEYVIAPSDPDGPVPGLLITGLPPGMQSQDNFDGTRTLRWRPLQPDVGTYAIRILVIDAADITLTRMYQFNVSVSLPDDLSTIPNLPPTIDAIDDYLVRAGDDLVMRVKAVDANGTIPALTLETDLAGATFEPFPSDERVRVLRWTLPAGEVGVREIEFRAEDADDAALVATRSVELDVRDPQSFSLPGERLRQLAPSSGIQIGYASLLGISSQADAGLYQAIAAAEFDLVTAENSMKWGYINPEPGRWRWDDADELVATARANEQALHAHALVWYTQLPQWVQQSEVDERETLMNAFIDSMVDRYNDDVAIWDVVNEALADDGTLRRSVWFEAMGKAHIAKAFRRTQAAGASGKLLYNDYDVAFPGPKSDALIALVTELVQDEVPIDGVGFQMHLDADFADFDGVAETFAKVRALGLEVYITELDVSIRAGQTEAQQAEVYANVLRTCLAETACRALQIWGFTDRYSWRRETTPLVLDRAYLPKPAYLALQEVFLEQ